MLKEASRRNSVCRDIVGSDWDTWRPQRWLADGILRSREPLDTCMFGHGPRQCPGMFFANTVGPWVLAEIARRYCIAPWEGPPLGAHTTFTTCPVKDVRLRLSRRL
mmetsp:Transcript_47132/g.137036  ORF Transcript_47132/g.137036 Transcript_47132/m.137036 type:complete len:106 (+) Transcript_47132:3-320(+)